MKKAIGIFAFLLSLTILSHAQVVSVLMEKTVMVQGEEISFDIRCASEQDLEIVVFTEGHLVSTQKATLPAADNPFHFSSNDCPAGKYFVLVTGNGIHVEREFVLTKK